VQGFVVRVYVNILILGWGHLAALFPEWEMCCASHGSSYQSEDLRRSISSMVQATVETQNSRLLPVLTIFDSDLLEEGGDFRDDQYCEILRTSIPYDSPAVHFITINYLFCLFQRRSNHRFAQQ
jgi:hypothetical protein